MRKLLALSALLLLAACAASAPAPSAKRCVIGGCSGQFCTDAADGDVISTCEWRAAYGCYKKHSTCQEQPDGACGWTPTDGLQRCLAEPEKEFPL